MKKQVLSVAVLSAFILAGCSNDDVAVKGDNDGLVKVELGTKTPAIVTKAALFDDNWVGSTVTVWGLSKNTTLDWTIGEGSCLFQAGGVTGTVTAGDPESSITLDGDYYYPAVGGENYSFYAYYPSGEAMLENNQLVKTYTLTGVEDVLWGKAVADTLSGDIHGFNAKYFRKGGTTPNIQFDHMLTRFTFEVQGGDDNAGQIVIDEIKLLEVPNEVSLVIADKNQLAEDYKATLTATGEAECLLYDAEGTPAVLDGITADPQQVGESIMAPESNLLPQPADGASKTYKVSIKVHSKREGSTYNDLFVKALPLPVNGATTEPESFKAGNSYKVTMTVYGESEIRINTSLEAWKTQTDPVDLGELN